MELLHQLHQQGFKVILVDDKHIGVMPKDRITPELAQRIKAQKSLLIETLRKQTRTDEYTTKMAHKYQSKGQVKKSDPGARHEDGAQASQEPRRYCEGYQPPRYVHPEVCKRHIEEADLKCLNCKHLSSKEREIWMDAYLDGAIARLNTFHSHGDRIDWNRPGAREEIDRLEKAITEAFLQGDIQGYVDAVDKWGNLFRDIKVPLRTDNSNDIKK
ncbi:MAG: hypothetical protein JRH08_15825 [Deltaproteobacteria bacterium]|nr:hypothetical protein [Deltaproteobacteria bacterium]MBW2127098.1 hypothetical protein [Deltaproteobacteria bacterium]